MKDVEKLDFMIKYLEVLGNGYVKPDIQDETSNTTGVVRDTKRYFSYIEGVNESICELLGVSYEDYEAPQKY